MRRAMAVILTATLCFVAFATASPAQAQQDDFYMGVDVGTLVEVEASGERFYDDGAQGDALQIMADSGANLVRLRLWNDPYSSSGEPYGGGTNDLAKTIELAQRAKALGMDVLLDFHYSDFWVDPGKQNKPKAWENHSYGRLVDSVRDYTSDVVTQMDAAGAGPDIVQIGNETVNGMLWPEGSTDDWSQLAGLLEAGIEGVHQGGSGIEIALHLDRGGDNGAYRNWFDNARDQGLQYDIIALSYYPYWHGTLNDLRNNLNDVASRYGKDVLVVETAYGYTLNDCDGRGNIFSDSHAQESGYPATVQGQTDFLRDVSRAVADVPNDRGRGIVWWEPAWIGDTTWATQAGMDYIDDQAGESNSWDNQALFDCDGNKLPSLDVFGEFAGDGPGEPGGDTGELRSASADKCLDVPDQSTEPGTRVQIYDCWGGAGQQWTYTSAGELTVYSGGSQLCLDAEGGGTSDGTAVIIWNCNGQANQQWRLNGDGTVTGVDSGLCLDVYQASTANGAEVVLWSCHGGSNQQWTFG
ncbi:lectin [Glycomyces xiaoerkulensis]|uniref:lectin n=1 Tax=Glycomyces xiaoerkulensis TaxID=2038139 RepID=UPI000C255EBF|nr:lectin [Glycomyces xiaoerkulensis]